MLCIKVGGESVNKKMFFQTHPLHFSQPRRLCMGWEEGNKMDEKLKFIVRHLRKYCLSERRFRCYRFAMELYETFKLERGVLLHN